MNKKSRVILTVLLGLCGAVLAAGIYTKDRALAIIGGADGPTSVYIAAKVGPDPFLTLAAILAGAALAYYIIVKKKEKR